MAYVELRDGNGHLWCKYDPSRRLLAMRRGEKHVLFDLMEIDGLLETDCLPYRLLPRQADAAARQADAAAGASDDGEAGGGG